MPHIAAGVDFADQMASPGRRVALGPECHRDLEVWRWDVDESFDAIGGTLSAPMYHLLERPAQRTLLSDASKPAVGGGGGVSKLLRTGVKIVSPRNRFGSADRGSL